MLEKPLLSLQAASVARQAPVAADDPVAGHDDRDGIVAVGRPDRAHGARLADGSGEIPVRDRLPERDDREFDPDLALELGSLKQNRQVELVPRTFEVLGYLPDALSAHDVRGDVGPTLLDEEE